MRRIKNEQEANGSITKVHLPTKISTQSWNQCSISVKYWNSTSRLTQSSDQPVPTEPNSIPVNSAQRQEDPT